MERKFTFNDRTANVRENFISIDGFEVSPAEVPKVADLVGFAGKMANLEALPPEIKNDPFTITFNESGKHTLSRTVSRVKQTLDFSFDETSDVISMFQSCLDSSLDMKKLTPSLAPSNGTIGPEPGDIIEGR